MTDHTTAPPPPPPGPPPPPAPSSKPTGCLGIASGVMLGIIGAITLLVGGCTALLVAVTTTDTTTAAPAATSTSPGPPPPSAINGPGDLSDMLDWLATANCDQIALRGSVFPPGLQTKDENRLIATWNTRNDHAGCGVEPLIPLVDPTIEPVAADGTTTTTDQPETGPALTPAQENAVRSARSYLDTMGFSYQGLIDQLSSEHADKYAVEDATVAVDSLNVDWDAEAVEAAESYLATMGFSCQGLIDQLSSQHADKFTVEQATHGATQAGAC